MRKRFIVMLAVLCCIFTALTFTACIENHSHTFDKRVALAKYIASEATCTESAEYYYSCDCGTKGEGTFTYGKPLGHIFGSWEIVKEPTQTETGLKQRVCTRRGCSYTEDATIPVLHTHIFTHYVSDNNATCTKDGTKTAICDYEGCEEINTVTDVNSKLPHTFNKKVVTGRYLASYATCTEKAKYYYSCECGEKCDETFSTGDALGHVFTNYLSDNNATCEKDGTKTATCDHIGCSVTKTMVDTGSKLWHIFTKYISDNNATCTEDGTKTARCDHKGCSVTNTMADEGSKLGHVFTKYVSDNNATCTEDGTKTARCDHKGCSVTNTMADEGSKLPHTFDKQVATDKYLASEATCTEKAKYYYSCECGETGTETFGYGSAKGHTYSDEWTYSETEHWHEATCGHISESGRAKHTFDNDKKCTVCAYITVKPTRLELQSTVFDVDLSGKTAYLKVANAVTEYDFSDKFIVADGAKFDVCTDIECNNRIPSKRTNIAVGNNVFYILVTNGNDVASYTVTLRRRPIYTVTFNPNGGTAVENKQVEEDDYAESPISTRKGYDFISWDYDFSLPVLKDETITASWNIIAYTINYVLNGCENPSTNPATYTVEDKIVLSAPVKTGYTTKWAEGNVIEKGSVGDKIFTASCTVNKYNVSVSPSVNEGSETTVINAEYDYGTKITIGTKIYLGYEFFGWYSGNTLVSTDALYTFFVPANDVTLTAEIALKEEMANFDFSSTASVCKINGVKDETVTSLTIPEYVTDIEESAFTDCTDLTSVVWNAENCKTAGSYDNPIFKGCKNLTAVTIGEKVKNIPVYTFWKCYTNKNFYITDLAAWCRVTGGVMGYAYASDKNNLFVNGKLVTELEIPDGVTSIESDAFANFGSITSVTFPDSLKSIGYHAFGNCTGITELTIPDGVTSIGAAAFECCTGLRSITLPFVGNYLYKESTNYYQYPFGYVFGDRYNAGCVATEQYYYGNSTSDPTSAVYYVPKSLKSVTITGGNLLYGAFYNCSGLTNITLPDTLTSIGAYAFYNCTALESIAIPDTVTSVGESAFTDCSDLASVAWNAENCKTAGSYDNPVFKGCKNLTAVTIGEKVKNIPLFTFFKCYTNKNFYISDLAAWCRVTGGGMFYASGKHNLFVNGKLVTELEIPAGVTSIGDSAFANFGSITSVTFSDSLKSIGYYAFSACTGITELTIPAGVTSIGDRAFESCGGLVSITVAEGNTKYHSSGNCLIKTETKTLILGCKNSVIPFDGSVTTIQGYAFYGCTGLTNITIPDSVTYIGDNAFSRCYNLTSVTIGSGVTTIGRCAFEYCYKLKEVAYAGSEEQWNAITIGENNERLTNAVRIYNYAGGAINYSFNTGCDEQIDDVNSICLTVLPTLKPRDGYTFGGWYDNADFSGDAVTAPYFSQDKTVLYAKWNAVVYEITYLLDGGINDSGNPATYTVEDEIVLSAPVKTGYTFTGWSDGGRIARGSIGDKTFTASYTINKYNVVVTPSLSEICTISGEGFYDYDTQVTLKISDIYLGYDFIGWYNGDVLLSKETSYTFNVPAGDTAITAKLSVKEEMQNYEFASSKDSCTITGVKDKTVESVSIPEYVTEIGNNAFYNCRVITVTIPGSVKVIGDNAFAMCGSLTSVNIGQGVTTIGNSAFYASGIYNLTIPDGVTYIGEGAFSNCLYLRRASIPDSVTYIGDNAFNGCESLEYNEYDNALYLGNSKNPYLVLVKAKDTSVTSCQINDNAKFVLNNAFYNCRGLTGITIPEGVTTIGKYAFYDCRGLTSITIPEGVKTIGEYAFSYCIEITSIKIPGSVTSIGNNAFAHCIKLVSAIIPDGVTDIGDWAFYNCVELKNILLGNSVASLGKYAFYQCNKLEKIEYNGTTARWNTIEKGSKWNDITGDYTVSCTDGEIKKS